MPAIRYYTVIQTREVQVSANSPLEAATLADRVFSGTKYPEDQINVRGQIEEMKIVVIDERSLSDRDEV